MAACRPVNSLHHHPALGFLPENALEHHFEPATALEMIDAMVFD
jgi:hypothetical protein